MTVDAFLDIIRTEKTRQIYAAQLKAFESWSGIRDFKAIVPKLPFGLRISIWLLQKQALACRLVRINEYVTTGRLPPFN